MKTELLRRYLSLVTLMDCMRQVEKGCELLRTRTQTSDEEQIVLAGIVVTYCRIFENANGAAKLSVDEFDLSREEHELHGHLETARDKMYAHIDLSFMFTNDEGAGFNHYAQTIVTAEGIGHQLVPFMFYKNIGEPISALAAKLGLEAKLKADEIIRAANLPVGTHALRGVICFTQV